MKEVKGMKEYEIIIETINPCGGDRHSQQEIVEASRDRNRWRKRIHGKIYIFWIMDNAAYVTENGS